jgi:hypothetical protein
MLVLSGSCARRRSFGVARDPAKYPQDTPQEALSSAIRALEAGDGRYFVAHLVDLSDAPDDVDQEEFERLSLGFEPGEPEDTLKVFREALERGRFHVSGNTATCELEGAQEIRFARRRGRWLVRN